MLNNPYLTVDKILSVTAGVPNHSAKYPHITKYDGRFYHNELFIYLEGSSDFRLGKFRKDMQKGNVIFIPQGFETDDYTVIAKEPIRYILIYFLTKEPLATQPVFYGRTSLSLMNMFSKISEIWIGKREGYYTKSMSILYDIINCIQVTEKAYNTSRQQNILLPAIEYLEQNYTNPEFDYKKLASLSTFSYSYFKKLFIKKYGCPPVKQVTNMRIRLACELLHLKRYSISDIALMCGFENVQYFSNTFKKTMGCSPTDYIAKIHLDT